MLKKLAMTALTMFVVPMVLRKVRGQQRRAAGESRRSLPQPM